MYIDTVVRSLTVHDKYSSFEIHFLRTARVKCENVNGSPTFGERQFLLV